MCGLKIEANGSYSMNTLFVLGHTAHHEPYRQPAHMFPAGPRHSEFWKSRKALLRRRSKLHIESESECAIQIMFKA